MQRPTRTIQISTPVARPSASTLPALARAWFRSERHYSAAARLRDVAPDPLPRPDPAALAAALGMRPRDATDRAALLEALGRLARLSPDSRFCRALADAVDDVQASLYP